MQRTMTPPHENLRRALRWLSDREPVSHATIEAASVRFDLGPRDEQFLLEHFVADSSADETRE